MKVHRPILLAIGLVVSLGAAAQYQWVDKDGRRVFSDRAPPLDVPAKNIVKQPTAPARQASPLSPSAGTATGDSASAPGANGQAPRAAPVGADAAAGKDAALDARKKALEAQEADKKKADEQRLAAMRADNCKRAQQQKASLDSGIRIARTNDKGEREFLDDAARAAEMQRTQSIIQSDCR